MSYRAIVAGASAGGIDALLQILSLLPPRYPLAVIVAQHLHPLQGGYLTAIYGRVCVLPVREAEEKERIQRGVVYLAPANYHLLVNDDETFALSVDERVHYARPSLDVLFESAADVYGPQLIGMVLTGANADGADGVRRIKEEGGLVIVQAPETAAADTMPRAALSATEVDFVLPLSGLGSFLALQAWCAGHSSAGCEGEEGDADKKD